LRTARPLLRQSGRPLFLQVPQAAKGAGHD
jgi:hypothetical protein